MVRVMVLKHFSTILLILSTGLLVACQSNSIQQPEIIPVTTSKPSIYTQEINPRREKTEQAPEIEIQPQAEQDTEDDIVSVLLTKAHKAISLKQWLRAQKALEQALRLEPNNARTFLLYGDIYVEIGAPELAKSMYQRALFLSHEGSDTKKLANTKLDQK